MAEQNHQTHWDSSIFALSSERLQRYEGSIIGSGYDNSQGFPILILTVRRDFDDLESKIILTHHASMFEDDELRECIAFQALPKAISRLYEDFKVQDPKELEGKRVLGIYFIQKLAGIRKNF